MIIYLAYSKLSSLRLETVFLKHQSTLQKYFERMNVYNLKVLYTFYIDCVYPDILVNDIIRFNMVIEMQMYKDN